MIRQAEPVDVLPVRPGRFPFGEVAGLFDDYRAHYGEARSPAAVAAFLTAGHLEIAAAVRDGRVCGFVTSVAHPALPL